MSVICWRQPSNASCNVCGNRMRNLAVVVYPEFHEKGFRARGCRGYGEVVSGSSGNPAYLRICEECAGWIGRVAGRWAPRALLTDPPEESSELAPYGGWPSGPLTFSGFLELSASLSAHITNYESIDEQLDYTELEEFMEKHVVELVDTRRR